MDNGYGDYDVPRSSKYGDYSVPRTQKDRDSVPGPRTSDTPSRQRGNSGEREMDYDVPLLKEERMRRDKVTSMLATRSRRVSDTSSESSRPHSNASSIYSGDASSVSLHSSHSGIKQAGDESMLTASIDQQLEMIDQLVEDVAAQNSTKLSLLSTSRVQRSVSQGLDEEGSSNSGSNDNLGVWDDVSTDSDSDEPEGKRVNERVVRGLMVDTFGTG